MAGATVTVWEIGSTGYGSAATMLGTPVTTAADGTFTYGSYVCPPVVLSNGTADAYLYITATGGDSGGGNNSSLALAAGIGDCTTAANVTVQINEVSTVALAYAMSAYFNQGAVPADSFGAPNDANRYQGMITANSVTIPLLTNVADGTVNPGGAVNGVAVTLEAAKIYSLANTLASCVNTADDTTGTTPAPSSACSMLFGDLTSQSSGSPTNTLEAAVDIATGPYQSVAALYQLGTKDAPFTGLSTAPNDWTVGVSYQTSGMGLNIAQGTSSNIDIDEYGRVWFPSNATGSTGLAYFNPAVVEFNGPYSADDGNSDVLVSPQYVALDASNGNDLAWATDLVTSYVASVSTSPLSSGAYAYGFVAQTSDTDLTGTSGPIVINADSSLDFAFTDSGSVMHLEEAAGTSLSALGTFSHVATGLARDPNSSQVPPVIDAATSDASGCYLETVGGSTAQDAIVASAGTGSCVSGGAAQNGAATNVFPLFLASDTTVIASTAGEICTTFETGCFSPAVGLTLPEGVAYDALGNLWIANSGNASISTLSGDAYQIPVQSYPETSTVQYVHDANNGGTMTTPYGIAIDGSGNVWVSNATCVAGGATCTATGFTLSELIGVAAPTITPVSSQPLGLPEFTFVRGTPHANRVPAHIRGK